QLLDQVSVIGLQLHPVETGHEFRLAHTFLFTVSRVLIQPRRSPLTIKTRRIGTTIVAVVAILVLFPGSTAGARRLPTRLLVAAIVAGITGGIGVFATVTGTTRTEVQQVSPLPALRTEPTSADYVAHNST